MSLPESVVQPVSNEQTESPAADPADVPRRSRRQEILLRVMLVGISTAMVVGALEICVRYIFPRLAVHTTADTPRQYVLPETAVTQRDLPYSLQKPPHTFRAFVVGDSFTFGGAMQVFDTYPKRLERYLNLNIDQPRVEVLNYSRPGTATVHHARFIHHILDTYQPDLIVEQITLNDPEPVPFTAREEVQREQARGRWNGPVLRHWKGLQFLLDRYYATKWDQEYRDYFFKIFANPNNWSAFTAALREMADSTRAQHVKFAVVIFPMFSYPLDSKYPFIELHKRIDTFLTELNVPYLDLFDTYKGMAHERLEVVPYQNGHPNEIANRIAADALYQWLGKQRLVPRRAIAKARSRFRRSGPLIIGPDDTPWERNFKEVREG